MIGGSVCGEEAFPGSLQQWSTSTKLSRTLYIPLQFWFNRNIGLALPLIALQYHEVKIIIEFRPSCELIITSSPQLTCQVLDVATIYVDYIYLDTDERRRFAQVSHEYLIEQLQFTGEESICNQANKIKLNFNHPVKELIWVVQHDDLIGTSEVNDCEGVLANNQWSNYTDVLGALTYCHYFPLLSGNPVEMAKLQLNGHDRFSTRLGDYFNLVQPYQHHTNIPLSPGINVYSFALRPEEHQPSGSANFSRIDNATLQISIRYANTILADCTVDVNGVPAATLEDIEPYLGCSLDGCNLSAKIRIYAVNYNVLRIMSGINTHAGNKVQAWSTCSQQLDAIQGFTTPDWVNIVIVN